MKKISLLLILAASVCMAEIPFRFNPMGVSGARLPAEYQEVEYLQSSGTQYIDTGFIPTINTATDCKLMHLSSASSQCGILDGDNQVNFGRSTSVSFAQINNTFATTSRGINEAYTLGVSFTNRVVNGVSVSWSPSPPTFTTTFAFPIFALRRAGDEYTDMGPLRVYYFVLSESGVAVRDYVPAVRKSDSVAGMYDLINGTFYTNAGTGTFIVGPDVN